jgi:hypothetical protein
MPPAKPNELLRPKLLIGEGDDEIVLLGALLGHLMIDDVQVDKTGGKDGFSKYMRVLRGRPGFERLSTIAIVRDADTDPAKELERVQGVLRSNTFPVPQEHAAFADGPPRVGIFILPDGVGMGMLEDLCLSAVKEDAAMKCVDDFITCVAACGRPGPPAKNLAKARIHAWLASHSEPDKRLGEAARAKYFPWDHAAFEPLREFIQLL